VIYVDSSVLLADVLAEPRSPSEAFWDGDLGSSRLLGYEVWNRIYACGSTAAHVERASALLARISWTELSQRALARALEPWPVALRALDALHLATMDFLRRQGGSIEVASYDNRLVAAARALGIPVAAL
jgi:predicted nucleic acid-binding protein